MKGPVNLLRKQLSDAKLAIPIHTLAIYARKMQKVIQLLSRHMKGIHGDCIPFRPQYSLNSCIQYGFMFHGVSIKFQVHL